jgi:hypothetical protein
MKKPFPRDEGRSHPVLSRRVALVAMGGFLTAGLTSCARFLSGGSGWDPFTSAEERRVLLRVQNLHSQEVRVRAWATASRHDLGPVAGRGSRQIRVPWTVPGEVRFEIDPILGSRFTTPGVWVSPGDQVELVVVDPVQRSFVRR